MCNQYTRVHRYTQIYTVYKRHVLTPLTISALQRNCRDFPFNSKRGKILFREKKELI